MLLGTRRVIACVTAAMLLTLTPGGCAGKRAALTTEQLEARRVESLAATAADIEDATHKTVARMHREHEDYRRGLTDRPPTFDILILSGGGDYGAFGAGFLAGWGKVEGDLARPDFDVVTGVSTGALIAPFAFIDDSRSIETVVKLYSAPKKDWIRLRDIFFFLPGRESFMDVSGLQRDLCAQVNMDIIRQIAARSAEGRVLAVGTTDLDLGVLKPWRLSIEAERAAESNDPSRVHKILMASAAIPAVFPPVQIDGGLYVDGGTTANILFGFDARAPSPVAATLKRDFPATPIPKMRYWVIINNQLGAAPQVVQPRWTDIVSASVSTAIRSSTIGSLKQLGLLALYAREVEGIDAEFRFVAIPDDWRPPKPGIFEAETMRSLAELGERLGSMAATPERPLGPWSDALVQPLGGVEPGRGATPRGPTGGG